MQDISPAVPTIDPDFLIDTVDKLDLLLEQLEVTNTYLSYIFSTLLWVIILMVFYMLFKFLHRTLFRKNDFLN